MESENIFNDIKLYRKWILKICNSIMNSVRCSKMDQVFSEARLNRQLNEWLCVGLHVNICNKWVKCFITVIVIFNHFSIVRAYTAPSGPLADNPQSSDYRFYFSNIWVLLLFTAKSLNFGTLVS